VLARQSRFACHYENANDVTILLINDGSGSRRATRSVPGLFSTALVPVISSALYGGVRRVLRRQWPAFVLAFVLPLVAVYWWWGGFRSVDVTEAEAGPYRFAYLDYDGPLSNVGKTQRAALDRFERAGVAAGDTLSVILSDPRADNGRVHAQLGYTLAEAATVPEGLKEGRIERRPVWRAEVQAAVILAPSKAYQALADALAARGKTIVMPTVELYRPTGEANRIGTFTLEMNR